MGQLNWGQITPDGIDKNQNIAVHVYNFTLQSESDRLRAKLFVIGRVQNFAKHLPQGYTQKVYFDLKGQALNRELVKDFELDLVMEIEKRLPLGSAVIQIINVA